MDEAQETCTAARCSPLQHLQVSVRVAESENRPPPDKFVDGHGLADFVVDEIDLRQPYQHRLAISHLKLGLNGAANDLLGRNAIDLFCPRTHKLDSTPRYDIGLETVGAQIRQEFKHGLIDHCRVRPP